MREMYYQKTIKYWGINESNSTFKLCIPNFHFNHPFDILNQIFHGNDHTSNISSIAGAEEVLDKINQIENGLLEYCLITVNQDPIIKCSKENSKITDPGPDEIHSFPPSEIYPPNWNKQNPGMDIIPNEKLKAILEDWIKFLKYSQQIRIINLNNDEFEPADNKR
jgi:hypothetical protein